MGQRFQTLLNKCNAVVKGYKMLKSVETRWGYIMVYIMPHIPEWVVSKAGWFHMLFVPLISSIMREVVWSGALGVGVNYQLNTPVIAVSTKLTDRNMGHEKIRQTYRRTERDREIETCT